MKYVGVHASPTETYYLHMHVKLQCEKYKRQRPQD